LVNLAHGSLYMLGAYFAATLASRTGSLFLALPLALAGVALVGAAVELVVLRRLYARDHLDQVLATFGLILFFNELTALIWGRGSLYTSLPSWLQGHVTLFTGSRYPLYRLVILVVGLVVAVALWYV